MNDQARIRFAILGPAAALLLLLAAAGTAGFSTGHATASPAAGGSSGAGLPCRQFDFDKNDFPRRPEIDNRFLPMEPGTRMILEGAVEGVPHRVEFTVTDLTKVVDGVRTVVVWDTDTSEDKLVESELAFFAQDKDGTVWNLGEYPEEFENGEFVGAPSTWITGQDGAKAGIHMLALRGVSSRLYVQGFAPEIDFLDCARIVDRHERTCVPAGCFDDVTITHETNILDPEAGIQSKYHAPRVGIVQVGSVKPANGETLALTARKKLTGDDLKEVREEALRLDRRGYRFGGEPYQATEPAKRLRRRHAATKEAVATPTAPLSPQAGAIMTAPPMLTWRSDKRATYYNVQVWRRGRIFSAWPTRNSIKLTRTWTYDGRRYRLSPGRYRWYVWPGYGLRAQGNFGRLIGSSSFVVRS
jgi:hypothetical protein